SPFFVVNDLREWRNQNLPRRAGISSFGIGGTNAHVVIEQAPARQSCDSRPFQLLLLSAKTEAALNSATANLAQHLEVNSGINLADAAYTLQTGRREFAHRSMLVCGNVPDAVAKLKGKPASRIVEKENPRVV